MKMTKKTRRTPKPKIRWEVLGLSDPRLDESTTSIETIRREVSLLASSGLGKETTIRSAQGTKGRGRGRQPEPDGGRMRRRGATE